MFAGVLNTACIAHLTPTMGGGLQILETELRCYVDDDDLKMGRRMDVKVWL